MAELEHLPEGFDFNSLKDRPSEWLNYEDVQYIYANALQMKVSLFDIWIDVGVMEEASAERLRVRSVARLILSPQLARTLRDILVDKIGEYERLYGAIPRNPQV